MYSLHPPSGTVNCVEFYRYNHCKLCIKFFVRFMPQINRWFTDYTGFPVRSVFSSSLWWGLIIGMPPGSLPLPPWGGTLRPIFIVRFVLRFLEAMQESTALSGSQVDALSASYRNPPNSNGSTNYHDIHQFLLLWQYDCGLRLQVCPFQGWLLQSDPTRSSSIWKTCHG